MIIEKGEVVSEGCLVTNNRHTAFADNKSLNAVILSYRQIGPMVSWDTYNEKIICF